MAVWDAIAGGGLRHYRLMVDASSATVDCLPVMIARAAPIVYPYRSVDCQNARRSIAIAARKADTRRFGKQSRVKKYA
jgi:hypothetical protein